jgi:hypothetical protein
MLNLPWYFRRNLYSDYLPACNAGFFPYLISCQVNPGLLKAGGFFFFNFVTYSHWQSSTRRIIQIRLHFTDESKTHLKNPHVFWQHAGT